MRVLFLTRLHPLKNLGPLESRLHDRLTELSELGHEVLVLTKWSGESVDFELPSRIEIRSPFRTFRPWEWPRALPMVFAWRPDLLHVLDPGLSKFERNVSIEMIAMTMLETMGRASRGRSSFRGSLVSLENTQPEAETGWKRAGASVVESEWLRPTGANKSIHSWDRANGRKLRIVLAGRIGKDHPFERVIEALQIMRTVTDFELTIFLKRSELSMADRKRLAKTERCLSIARDHAVGSRLHAVESEPNDGWNSSHQDVAIVAGLETAQARSWIERLEMPVIMSENQSVLTKELQRSRMSAQVLGSPVTDIASLAQALFRAIDRDSLNEAWRRMESGELTGGRDVAANQLSRIYSQIAGMPSSSYS